jgi:predicted dehydrogenase
LLRKHLHYDWHWVWPTGNGDLGNQGIHQMDLARWVLGETALSPRVLSVGGRLGYEDDGTTPNTQIVLHDYPAAPLIFEVRGLPASRTDKIMDRYHGASIGVVVECEGGWMVIGDDANSARVQDKDGNEIKRFEDHVDHGAAHFANFIAAVRGRNQAGLKADILEGHLSSALCHTGNMSYRLGRARAPGEIREAVKAEPGMAEALGRMEEHLAANHVDLAQTPATLGVLLSMDPVKERFIANEAADLLLTRDYRQPFVVPINV